MSHPWPAHLHTAQRACPNRTGVWAPARQPSRVRAPHRARVAPRARPAEPARGPARAEPPAIAAETRPLRPPLTEQAGGQLGCLCSARHTAWAGTRISRMAAQRMPISNPAGAAARRSRCTASRPHSSWPTRLTPTGADASSSRTDCGARLLGPRILRRGRGARRAQGRAQGPGCGRWAEGAPATGQRPVSTSQGLTRPAVKPQAPSPFKGGGREPS